MQIGKNSGIQNVNAAVHLLVGAISTTWISSMMNDDGAGDDGIYIDTIAKSIKTFKADKLH